MGKTVSPEIKKKLLFSEVLTTQIKDIFTTVKHIVYKHNVAASVTGKTVKLYKYLNYMRNVLSQRTISHQKKKVKLESALTQ